MIHDRIDLYTYFSRPRGTAKAGTLTRYLHAQITEWQGLERVRPALLVIPGGGYAMVSQREAEPIAVRFFEQGYNVFVLEYDVAPVHYPVQLLQAGMAMLYLRRESAALAIDGRHIAAVGFSAGGHLCGCISLLWDDPALREAFGDECAKIRPDAALLGYPVISCDPAKAHIDSFANFCGGIPFEAYSLEKRVRPSAPPCFIWATTTDDVVPVENSLRLYSALHEAGVPAEMHLFEKGQHGLATCDEEVFSGPLEEPYYAQASNWLPLAFGFLRARGFVLQNKE